MAQKLTASMPPALDLGGGYSIVFAAVDPSTGADVTDVVVSGVQIHCDNIGPTTNESLEVGPFMLVPGPEA